VAGFFHKLGKLAGPRVRKGKWLWQSLTGSQDDVLKAEHNVGRDMAAEVRRQLPPDDDPETAALIGEIGVLGHEMAHVIRGHALDRMLSSSATVLAARAVPAGGVGAWVKQVGLRYLEGAYSRDRELGADELGVRLADAAGYDRRGAARLLERLGELHARGAEGALRLGRYFASHPPTDDRIRQVHDAPPV